MIAQTPADRRLLAALARILREIDPVPPEVVAAAEALYSRVASRFSTSSMPPLSSRRELWAT